MAKKRSGIASATIWTHVEGHDFIHVAVTGAPALQLHHLLEFESLYGELICQAFCGSLDRLLIRAKSAASVRSLSNFPVRSAMVSAPS